MAARLLLLSALALVATLTHGQSCPSDYKVTVANSDFTTQQKGTNIAVKVRQSVGGTGSVRVRSSQKIRECTAPPAPTPAPVAPATAAPVVAATPAPTPGSTAGSSPPPPPPVTTTSAGIRTLPSLSSLSSIAVAASMLPSSSRGAWVPVFVAVALMAIATPAAAQTCTPSFEFDFDLPNAGHAAGLEWVAHAYNNNGLEMRFAERRYAGLASQLKPIGSHTGLMVEASDAMGNADLMMDGMSGDTAFPHGSWKALATIGEYDKKTGYLPVGVPDGQGVYLKDDKTIRLIFQAESYGHLRGPSWYLPVNDGKAHFTGSHVSYIDYDRAAFAEFMTHSGSAEPMVKGAGELMQKVLNVAGKEVDGTAINPHYGDTAADGTFVTGGVPTDVYTFHSFCAAHLEEAHQWGEGIGLEDSMFVTNEEWTNYDSAAVAASGAYGLSAHVISLESGTVYGVGAFGAGGWEKIVELNCGVTGYVCFSPSGYNGNFGSGAKQAFVDRKTAAAGQRADGTDWAYPQDITPARVYIGVKGKDATGADVDCTSRSDDNFLACNGLAYGKVYGFAVPSATPDRDTWHKNNDRAQSPDAVAGVFAPTAWMWDGVVKDFEHDQAWDFQENPVHPDGANMKFWNALGRDTAGKKTEHNSPDPRGGHKFIQGSTAGYFGVYDMPNLATTLSGLAAGALPDFIDAEYWIVEGETDVSGRIELGGKGMRADGNDQTEMTDSSTTHTSFEDVDGLEWFAASDGDYVLIQEDGGNKYGERTLLFRMPAQGALPTYYFIGQSGGSGSSRSGNNGGVCVPAGTWTRATSHEFSGSSDVSGILLPGTATGGKARRDADATVAINDKILAMGLQAHTCSSGILSAFGLDRGGQIFAFKPALPGTATNKSRKMI